MTETNSYLCPGNRTEVGPEREPYPATAHWCQPDLEAAADLLRHVYQHQDEARHRGLQAAQEISALYSPSPAGAIAAHRLAKIRSRRAPTRPLRSIGLLEDQLEELEERIAGGESARQKTSQPQRTQ